MGEVIRAGPHDYKDVTIWTFDVNDVETTIREREADAMKEMALTDDGQHKLIGMVTRCARLRHGQYSTPSPSNMRHTSPRSTYTQRLSRSVSLAKPLLRYGEGAVTRTQRWFDCVSPSNGPLSVSLSRAMPGVACVTRQISSYKPDTIALIIYACTCLWIGG